MYRVPLILTALFALLLLQACQTREVNNADSPFYTIPAGSRLQLSRRLDIAPGQVSVIMQHGRLAPYNQVDRYMAHCKFEIRTIAETVRSVSPDDFIITRVVDQTEMVSLDGVTLASEGMGSDLNSPLSYVTTLYLESQQQPDVLRMACMHTDDYNADRYLTVNEMRAAMGDIFTLYLDD